MKLKYFASVRERLGMAEEEVELPAGVADVGALTRWLAGRGETYAALFSGDGAAAIRVAVDHEHADAETPVARTSEVALFPPMTGG